MARKLCRDYSQALGNCPIAFGLLQLDFSDMDVDHHSVMALCCSRLLLLIACGEEEPALKRQQRAFERNPNLLSLVNIEGVVGVHDKKTMN